MEGKRCAYCKETDPTKFTPKDKYRCKRCKAEEQRDWRMKNPVHARAIQRRSIRVYRGKLSTLLELVKAAHGGDTTAMDKLNELGKELNA